MSSTLHCSLVGAETEAKRAFPGALLPFSLTTKPHEKDMLSPFCRKTFSLVYMLRSATAGNGEGALELKLKHGDPQPQEASSPHPRPGSV